MTLKDLRRPLTICATAVALAAIVLVLGRGAHQSIDAAMTREYNRRHQSTTESIASRAGLFSQLMVSELRRFAESETFDDLAVNAQLAHLRDLGVSDITVLDSQGVVTYNSKDADLIGADFSNHEYFSGLRDFYGDTSYVARLLEMEAPAALALAVPLYQLGAGDLGESVDRKFHGGVLCRLELDRLLSQTIVPFLTGTDDRVCLVGPGDTVLWCSGVGGGERGSPHGPTDDQKTVVAPGAGDRLVAESPLPLGTLDTKVVLVPSAADTRTMMRDAHFMQVTLVGLAVLAILGIAGYSLTLCARLRCALQQQLQTKTQEVHESHGRLLAVLDSLNAIVYVADLDTDEILFVGKKFKEIFDANVGQNCWEALGESTSGPSGFGGRASLVDADGVAKGVQIWEYKNQTNGVWYEVRDHAISWTGGRLARLEIAFDISKRKDVEEELRRSRSFLQTVIDGIPELIMVIDLDFRIVMANRAAWEVSGGKAARENTPFCYQLSHHSQSLCCDNHHDCPLRRVLQTGKAVSTTHTHYDADGEEMIVEIVAAPIYDNSGKVVQIIESCRDITRRVRAEQEERLHHEQLVQMDKMASLGILVSGVAHEINNPIQFVVSNLTTLEDAWEDLVPILTRHYEENGDFVLGGLEYTEVRDQIPRMFSDAVEGCDRIKFIVQELRDYARSSPVDMNESVDLNAVVHSSIVLLTKMIEKSTRHFSLECEQSLPKVKGNYRRLEQVVVNLVQNACQALSGPESGITLRTRFDPESRTLVLEVSDEGEGIPDENMERISDPFFTTRRTTGGTGLGVSIAASILNEHGGNMTFVSSVGKGTTVEVRLPVTTPDDRAEILTTPSVARKDGAEA